jgi:cation diffusion facilitator family transporter
VIYVSAIREKQRAAMTSLAVAIALTSLKAIVGVLTNSLGIISEALHSGLDLVAAGTTVYAVGVSSKPPDRDYHFGHGKYESISAMVEVLLLFATCGWITYEAIERLLFRQARVEVSVASFLVMATSIVLDYSRSRILYRAAKKFKSQALEADALHFSTDIMSSSVVILGLFFISFGYQLADPLAALGVVVVVLALSLRLGKRTVAVLLDRAPEGLGEAIQAEVAQVPGVQAIRRVRVRLSGAQMFIDLQITINRSLSLERVNALANDVEHAIRKLAPNSDIVVDTQPAPLSQTRFADTIRTLSSRIEGTRGVHDIAVEDGEGGLHVEFHLEVDPNVSLEKAHEISTQLETAIKNSIPGIARVATHLESADEEQLLRADITSESYELVKTIRSTAMQVAGVKRCGEIEVHTAEDGLHLTVTCFLHQNLPITDAHTISTQIEEALRRRITGVTKVLVHVQPEIEPTR